MENCEPFFRLARREEGVERVPRLRSNEARREKGRSPKGPLFDPAKPLTSMLKTIKDFSFLGFSTGS